MNENSNFSLILITICKEGRINYQLSSSLTTTTVERWYKLMVLLFP